MPTSPPTSSTRCANWSRAPVPSCATCRPYSPDLNPIEPSFAQLKAYLRKAKERSIPALYNRIGASLEPITPAQCRNYFRKAGYAPS
jgi:transposase